MTQTVESINLSLAIVYRLTEVQPERYASKSMGDEELAMANQNGVFG
jgi:hypothetical protein